MFRRILLVCLLLAGIATLHYFAPLQPLPLIFDLALVAILAGAISLLHPLRFLDIRTRRSGLVVMAAGLAAAGIALYWPSVSHASTAHNRLDDFLPVWSSREFHSVLVNAPPDRVYRAVHETTFADVKAFAVLMQVRMAATGRFHRPQSPPIPILDAMTGAGSPFIVLSDDHAGEIVLGLAGRFWTSGRSARFATPAEFVAFDRPGWAKTVFNMKVEPAGNGRSRITTETRSVGTDRTGDIRMARYWRIIYPGSATIRRMWLLGIKRRAEHPS